MSDYEGCCGDGSPPAAMVDAANEAVSLRAENARLQEQVKEAVERGVDLWEFSQRAWAWKVGLHLSLLSAWRERDGYKAQSERRREVVERCIPYIEGRFVARSYESDRQALNRVREELLTDARAAIDAPEEEKEER